MENENLIKSMCEEMFGEEIEITEEPDDVRMSEDKLSKKSINFGLQIRDDIDGVLSQSEELCPDTMWTEGWVDSLEYHLQSGQSKKPRWR